MVSSRREKLRIDARENEDASRKCVFPSSRPKEKIHMETRNKVIARRYHRIETFEFVLKDIVCVRIRENYIYNILTPMLCVFSVLCRCAGISNTCVKTRSFSLLLVCLVFSAFFSLALVRKREIFFSTTHEIIFKLQAC